MRNRSIGKAVRLAGLCVLLVATARAGVDITWVEPEKFRDIRGGPVSQKSFQNQVIGVLTAYFEDAAAQTLPAGQTLRLTITDVDLVFDYEKRLIDDWFRKTFAR